MKGLLPAFFRILIGGVLAATAWWAGLLLVFGPAQSLLSDPARQSAKFLAAFTDPPLPRMAEHPETLLVGLLIVGWFHAGVFAALEPKLSGGILRKGITFGVIAWALMVPWFEFYLPWNVMREPLGLVALEGLCWLGVQLGVGLVLSATGRIGRIGRLRP